MGTRSAMPKARAGENPLPPVADMANMFDVRGKVVLVTGGGSGIGAMIAAGFCANGAMVIVSSRKDTTPYCEELTQRGPGKAYCITADAAKEADVKALVEAIKAKEGKLNVLVNNSGTNWGESLDTYPIAAFDKVMKLNVSAVFYLTQQCLPLLEAGGSAEDPARVINISSINGLGVPALETYAYSSSKAAVKMLGDHLAGFVAKRNITVNTICPGAFPSRMMKATLDTFRDSIEAGIPRQRVGGPLDMAGTCIYLASRAGAWTTGATLVLDGGASIAPRL